MSQGYRQAIIERIRKMNEKELEIEKLVNLLNELSNLGEVILLYLGLSIQENTSLQVNGQEDFRLGIHC